MTTQTLRIKITENTTQKIKDKRDELAKQSPTGKCSIGEVIRILIVKGEPRLNTMDFVKLETFGELENAVSVISASWIVDKMDKHAQRFGVTRARVIREAIELGLKYEEQCGSYQRT